MPDAGDAVGDRDARQAATAKEGTLPDAGDVVGDCDARQAMTPAEGSLLDGGDAVRDRDTCQVSASIEGKTPDAGDRIASNGVRNNQFPSGRFVTIGDGDFSVSRGPCQPQAKNEIKAVQGETIPGCANLAKGSQGLRCRDHACIGWQT